MLGGLSVFILCLNIICFLVVIFIMSFLVLVWYKYKDVVFVGYINIFVEYQVKYLLVDFKVDINLDDVFVIFINLW